MTATRVQHDVCEEHSEMVSGLASLVASLKWIVRLFPVLLAVGGYLAVQVWEVKQNVAVQAVELKAMSQKIDDHIKTKGTP